MNDRELQRRKHELRTTIRTRLASLDEPARRTAGEAVAGRIRAWARWREVRVVLSFLSAGGEIETAPIHRIVVADGKLLGLPRIAAGRLVFHRVRRPGAIRTTNRLDIREPSPSLPKLSFGRSTLVLVPGIAFDRSGRRLGRGGAFYDRFLADHGNLSTMGICFDFQIVGRVPAGPLDVDVQWVATETGIMTTKK